MCIECSTVDDRTHEHTYQFEEDLCNGDCLVSCSACGYKFPIENANTRHCPNKRCDKILVYHPWYEW
jgi:hypothetical protein